MKSILIIDTPNSCDECKFETEMLNCGKPMCVATPYRRERIEDDSLKPSWCPLKPLNKIVKAGDRNLIIYERAWLYSHLEEEFEMQKKARDWEKQNESNISS